MRPCRWMAAGSAALLLAVLPLGGGRADEAGGRIEITRSGTQPTTPGPAQRFTGTALVRELFGAHAGISRATGGSVTFVPGARSAWHTHPAGQILIIVAGEGRVQQWGGPVQVMRAGDVIWIPPGTKHWHGAAPTSAITHIALQDTVDGRNVDWLEKVTDWQDRGAP